MYITVAETPEFARKAAKLLDEEEKDALIAYIASHPDAGVIVKGTGGLRKLRWAREGRGKSGGVRVVYFFHNESMPVFMLSIFGKGEKDNLSKAERNEFAQRARALVNTYLG